MAVEVADQVGGTEAEGLSLLHHAGGASVAVRPWFASWCDALGPQEKEQLLRVLLEELGGPPDPDVERVWLEEAQRRSNDFDNGLISTSPGEDVFRRAREDLRRR